MQGKTRGRLLALCLMLSGASAGAADASYSVKLMTPETALKAALAGLQKCRANGFQVAIAIVDRSGQTQVMLRDRYAGLHTPETAINKAWTAASFKIATTALAQATEAGKEASGIRTVARVVANGGGLPIEVGGVLYGAIGVSGAPGGAADDVCAQAGIAAIAEDLEF